MNLLLFTAALAIDHKSIIMSATATTTNSRGVTKVVPALFPVSGHGPVRLIGTVDCDGAGTKHPLPEVDPCILLDVGVLKKNNMPPFGPHPHRGHSVVTVLLQGSLKSWDSYQPRSSENGSTSTTERVYRDVITGPASYWVDAGTGLFHDEMTSIKDESDPTQHVKLFQLWVGIAEADRTMSPTVQVDTKLPTFDCMGHVNGDGGGDQSLVLVGHGRYYVGTQTSIETPHPVTVAHIHQKAGTTYKYPIESRSHGGFVVSMKGSPTFGVGDFTGKPQKEYDVLVLNHDNGEEEEEEEGTSCPDFLKIVTSNNDDNEEDAEYLICTGERIGESWVKKLVANGALIAATSEEAKELATKVSVMSKQGLEDTGSFSPFGL